MNVSLTPELESFVNTKVQSGRYNSASEVIREALRLLEEQEQVRQAQLTAFRREIDRRMAALDRGERVDPATPRAEIRKRSEARRQSSR
ncbi:MAG: type II toxin-antitoxin system ParD family antitoxin [candidate division NC10 bacterium]|nr:type II toxin-antitoxin system ParD family antitoxin [candidate division NC10 bacterium]